MSASPRVQGGPVSDTSPGRPDDAASTLDGPRGDLSVIAQFLEPQETRLVERVHRAVGAALRQGAIPPGVHLVEAELASLLKVSRTPVREALRRLEAEGLVRFAPNRGFVALDWMTDAEQVFLIRERLEGLAARLAAQRISLVDLEQLADIQSRLEAAIEAVVPARSSDVVRLNGEFHKLISRCADSPRLLSLIERMQVDYVSYQVVRAYSHEQLLESVAEHREIVDALWRRDFESADSLVQRHLARGKRIVLAGLVAPTSE